MATQSSFTQEYIISDLVDWFNALPEGVRIIKPLDLPFYNVKVLTNADSTSHSIVVGDLTDDVASSSILGEATLIWVGRKHPTEPQTATASDFFEISKSLSSTASIVELVPTIDAFSGVTAPSADKIYYLQGIKSFMDGGEGYFQWDTTRLSSDHDGGTVIWPGVTLSSNFSDDDYKTFLFETPTGSSGCFVRVLPSRTFLGEWFGVSSASTSTQDMSDRMQALVQAAGRAGGGDCLVSGGVDELFIDGFVSIEYDNVNLRVNRDILFGPGGIMRIFGGLDEYRKASALPALSANSTVDTDGRMVLTVRTGEGVQFSPGDRITIRGLQDASGISLQKQTTIVYSVVGDVVTCVDEPDYTFQVTYPNSDYPGDHTIGTLISFVRYSYFTGDMTTTTSLLPVADASQFVVGDLVKIEDSRVEHDYDPIVPYYNACNMEILKIVAINYTTNVVTVERAIKRKYLTAWQGGISKIIPVNNSSITIGNSRWTEVQSSKGSILQCIYSANCWMTIGNMMGAAGRRGASGRMGYSYRCVIKDSSAMGAYSYGSGEGYGFTLYYSTYCTVKNTLSASNRHNFLFQASTDCTVEDCISDDDYISGIDAHGCLCIGTRIINNRIGRSNHFADTTLGAAIRIGNSSHALGDVATEISGNYISGYKTETGTGAAVDVVPQSSHTIIRDNIFMDCDKGVRLSPNRSDILPEKTTDVMFIQGNQFTRVTDPLSINLASTGEVNQVIFTDNTSYGNANQFAFSNVTTLILMDNKIIAPVDATKTGFTITNVANLVASNNYAKLAKGLTTSAVPSGRVIRNLFGDCTTPTSFAVSDNVVAFGNDNTESSGTGGGIAGINVLDEGTSVSSATTDVNFVGAGVTVTKTGTTTTTVTIPQSSAGIAVQDEGVAAGSGIQTLNFVGSNVVATASGTTATVTVLSSGASTGAGQPYKKTIAIYGDSITANNSVVASTPETLKSNGYWAWCNIFTGGRLHFPPAWNFGVGGNTTADALARINAVVAVQPDYCYVGIGTNDYLKYNQGGPATPDVSIANLTTIYDTLQNAGCFIIAPTLYAPTVAYNAFNATQLDFLNRINNFIRAQQFLRKNFEVIDLELTFADPAQAMPRAKANYTIDGLHPGTMGAFLYGQKVAALISKLEPFERNELFVHPSNTWTTNNPYGNLIANAEIVGSTGTISGSGVSGVSATKWRLDQATTGSGMTAVGSIETGTDLPGMNKQVIVIGGTLTADDSMIFSQPINYTDGTNFTAGDYIEAIADIEIINPVSIACVSLDIRIQSSTQALKYANTNDAQGTNATPVISSIPDGTSYRATYRTPAVQISADVTNIRPRIVIDAWSGTSPSGTIKVSRVVFRKAQVI